MSKNTTFSTTVEHPKYGETDVRVEYNYVPAVPGLFGRGEHSYPPEPAEAEILSIIILRCHEIKNESEARSRVGEEIELEDLSDTEQEKLEDQVLEAGAEAVADVYEARAEMAERLGRDY